jgi:hypothetical protein
VAGDLGGPGPLQRPRIPCLRPRQHAGTEGQRHPIGARQRGWRGGDRHVSRWGDSQAGRSLAHLDGKGRAGPGRDHGRPAGSPGPPVGGDRKCGHHPHRQGRADPVQHPQWPAQRRGLWAVAGSRRRCLGGDCGGPGPLHRRADPRLSRRGRSSRGTDLQGHAGRHRHRIRGHRARGLPHAGRALRLPVAAAAGGWRAQPGQGQCRQPVGGDGQQRPGTAGFVRRGALHQRTRAAEQPRRRTAGRSRRQHLGGHQCRPAAPERCLVQYLERRPGAERRLRARALRGTARRHVDRYQPRPQPLARWPHRGHLQRRRRPAQRFRAQPSGIARRLAAGRQLYRWRAAHARRQGGGPLRQRPWHARQQPGARAGRGGGRDPVDRHLARTGALSRWHVQGLWAGRGTPSRVHHLAAHRPRWQPVGGHREWCRQDRRRQGARARHAPDQRCARRVRFP